MLLGANHPCHRASRRRRATDQAQLAGDAEFTPVVPRYGSVGCSGDLAPLAHIGLALVGEGEVTDAEGNVKPRHKRSRP